MYRGRPICYEGVSRENTTEKDCHLVPKPVAMDGASSSKTALKRGADRESRRSTSPTHKRQRPNDEQSGNLELTGS